MPDGPETFSAAELLETVDGDVELLGSLLDGYAADHPPVLAAMREALAGRDGARLAEQAHLMKNVVGMAGGVASRALASAIEAAAEAGDFTGAATNLTSLEPELLRLEAAFRAFVAERSGTL